MPTSHESDGTVASPHEASKRSSNPEQDTNAWHNVLHILSTTVRGTGRGDFCAGGDSGAVVFDEKGTCVGLLFGRIDSQVRPSGGGLATPIHAVFDALNITLASRSDLQVKDMWSICIDMYRYVR
jgi:hypothetical protein